MLITAAWELAAGRFEGGRDGFGLAPVRGARGTATGMSDIEVIGAVMTSGTNVKVSCKKSRGWTSMRK